MKTLELFSGTKTTGVSDFLYRTQDVSAELVSHRNLVRRSVLWSVYGDALGWISELTDERGLLRRTAGEPLNEPMSWQRRIGGRAGITAYLPQGCYSDDSQLRLATARAIRPDGFDVEAFAKVELSVWLSYALGEGRATRLAASNLVRPRVPWFANTFKGWHNSGGNGAAMRIQPHVWSARMPERAESFLPDVFRNAICTHSHPTGLMGAVLHSLSLAFAMVRGYCPSPKDLLNFTDVAAQIPDMMMDDVEVHSIWRPTFEQVSGSFEAAWARAVAETRDAILIACGKRPPEMGTEGYAAMVERLGLRHPSRRGSGILTAVAAVGLLWCEERPSQALRIAANALGTDTDTIATMAGAILGVMTQEDPPVEVLDMGLFQQEADRLAMIAYGGQPQCHFYPDLLHWAVPKTRSDSLVQVQDGSLYVRGLGRATAESEPMISSQKIFLWQWLKLESGQTLFIKRRRDLEKYLGRGEGSPATSTTSLVSHEPSAQGKESSQGYSGHLTDVSPRQMVELSKSQLDLEVALQFIADNKDNDRLVGRSLRRVVNKGTPGQIAAFTAILIDYLRDAEVHDHKP